MFCPNCGSQVEDGTVFCPNCGSKIEAEQQPQAAAPQPQAPEQQPEYINNAENNTGYQNSYEQQSPAGNAEGDGNSKGQFSTRSLIGIAGVLVAIVAVIIVVKVVAGLFSGTPDSLATVYDYENEETTIYLNNKMIDTVDGRASVYTNADKSAFYIIDGDDDAYFVKGNKLKAVMDDCSYIVVANHSKTALLINDDDKLYRYNGSKLTEISDDDVTSAVISGNGKTYAYVSDGKTYIGKNPGKDEKVKGVYIQAISENGKYMYGFETDDDDDVYYTESGTLVCVNQKGDVTKISKDVSSITGYNTDGTEIMFIKDGKTYVSVKGKDAKKVSGGTIRTIYCKQDNEKTVKSFYPTKSFKNTVVVEYKSGDTNICKINSKYETVEVVGDIDWLVGIDSKLSKFYYEEDGDLYFAKVKKNAKTKRIAEDVESVFVSNECKFIYYLDDDDDLYYIKGSGKAKQISGDFEELYDAVAVGDGLYLYDDDDDFYYVKGTRATKLSIDSFNYDYLTERGYACKGDNVYALNGKSLKKLKGDYDDIGSIYVY